jgi:hydrophobic/amphiphilic exporter-1 (mainly G- bacteria), HAE1 family
MVLDLLLAVVIVYLVMAVLFESFVYPLVIILARAAGHRGRRRRSRVLNLFTFSRSTC